MLGDQKEEEKGSDTRVWIQLIGYIVTFLVAATTVLSLSKNVPSWWFDSSLILLIILAICVPIAISWKSISGRGRRLIQTRKENSIVRKHFKEFEALADKLAKILFPFSELWSLTRAYYISQHSRPAEEEMFPVHLIDSIQNDWGRSYNKFYDFRERCKGFSGNKRDFSLLLNEFNRFLEDAQSQVRIFTICANEMKLSTTNPQIMKKYDDFREQYNMFVNEYATYCHKLNQELGPNAFWEHFENIKKW